MNDKDAMTPAAAEKKARKPYQPPLAVKLGELARGEGNCSTGSSPTC